MHEVFFGEVERGCAPLDFCVPIFCSHFALFFALLFLRLCIGFCGLTVHEVLIDPDIALSTTSPNTPKYFFLRCFSY